MVVRPVSAERSGLTVAVVAAAGLVALGVLLVGSGLALRPLDRAGLDRAGALLGPTTRGSSRSAPLAFGDSLVFEVVGADGRQRSYEVVVTDPISDATARLVSSDSGNTVPSRGRVFALAKARLTYVDGPEPAALADLRLVAETEDGRRLTTWSAFCGVLSQPLETQASVYRSTVLEGELCWNIDAGELEGLRLVLEGPSGEQRWLALR